MINRSFLLRFKLNQNTREKHPLCQSPLHGSLKVSQMRVFCTLLCLSIAAEDGETFVEKGGGVRGPRIVEHGTQSECKQDSWPACSDDDWGVKCPSVCRMQGLIDDTDKNFGNRIDTLRRLLLDGQNNYKKSTVLTQETVAFLKGKLASDTDNNYGQVSDDLRRRLVSLKERVFAQVNRINALQKSIRDQVVEMKRLEVDIDIKIRACKGSCGQSVSHNVETESYENIQKQLTQANAINLQPQLESSSLRILKMRPIKDSTVSSDYKSLQWVPENQELNILNDLKQVEMELVAPETELRGSPVEASHVLVGAGVSGGSHTAKLVTPGYERGTLALEERPSSTVVRRTCTKTITTKMIQGPDGPREETVEEMRSSDGSDFSGFQGVGKETGGTFYSTVTSSGRNVDLPEFSSFFPDAEKFFDSSSLSTGSRLSSTGKTVSHSATFGGSESSSDLREGEVDDFGSLDFHPSFSSSKVQGGGSRTVVTSSSSSSSSVAGFNKGGSTFETKSLKSHALADELGGVQHDESGEDVPDFRARSLRTGEEKLGKDCDDIRQKHTSGAQSGIFRIKPEGSDKGFSVYCDQSTTLGGWLLIQQRLDGSVNFNRSWEDYKNGFGTVDGQGKGEFWLGNENIHLLTQKDTVLRVELEDWAGNAANAEYNIHIGSEPEGFALSVSDYEGTAGDALIVGSLEEGSEYTAHDNMKFSTFDRDNDQWEENCAEVYGGGWWYNNCQAANLNGIYYPRGLYDPRNNTPYETENGVVWTPFRASDYSLKVVRMKIRPIETQ
uniref:Fibrinogen alpha chain n=1 Tax=Sphenodon punctatus TaxID=8508 RepID=A0A8D0H917_SPHPU